VTADVARLTLSPLTQDEAEAIAEWHYETPYDFYDLEADHRDAAELLDPELRGNRYFAGRDAANELVAYFGLHHDEGVVGVGIGLRPDLTGRGLGLSVLEQGLAFARERFAPRLFRLSVAEFNARAIAVYERAGFVRTRSFMHETNGGTFAFLEMERPA
jgi:ribosomal-protein-alanine N-acetyltransferase